jgi:hypothetical protein
MFLWVDAATHEGLKCSDQKPYDIVTAVEAVYLACMLEMPVTAVFAKLVSTFSSDVIVRLGPRSRQVVADALRSSVFFPDNFDVALCVVALEHTGTN